MIIESLYPEICCLYGDLGNTVYLRHCLPDATFAQTSLTSPPVFLSQPIDLLYLCSMSERAQEIAIQQLLPHRCELAKLLDGGQTTVLLTGNALEIFGQYIQRPDGSRIDGLGLLDFYSVRVTPNRFNSLILASFQDTKIVGYTSRFSHTYTKATDNCQFKVEKGVGFNPGTDLEGLHVGKLYATYLHGPLLIANPAFTKALLADMGVTLPRLPFEDEVQRAYLKKLAEYEQPSLQLD
ncbi:MAG: hypothetical protein FWF36_10110 [Propionibacteriaceae bacterium]|nr:hypothetical protein [Propionibacteriaceae bacterium]